MVEIFSKIIVSTVLSYPILVTQNITDHYMPLDLK